MIMFLSQLFLQIGFCTSILVSEFLRSGKCGTLLEKRKKEMKEKRGQKERKKKKSNCMRKETKIAKKTERNLPDTYKGFSAKGGKERAHTLLLLK